MTRQEARGWLADRLAAHDADYRTISALYLSVRMAHGADVNTVLLEIAEALDAETTRLHRRLLDHADDTRH